MKNKRSQRIQINPTRKKPSCQLYLFFENRFNKVLKIKSNVVLPFLPVGFGSHTVFLTSRGGRSRDRQHHPSPQSPGTHAGSTRKEEATIKW